MNTTTVKAIATAALQWLRVNAHYLSAFKRSAPVRVAAGNEYRQKFNRDLEEDLEKYERSQL